MLPIRLLTKTPDEMRWLWERWETLRPALTDEAISDPFAFYAWVGAADSLAFAVGPADGDPVGLFLFTGIAPGDAAFCHVFVWDRDRGTPADLRDAARVACAAVMHQHGLRRLNGLTPCDNVPARVFAERVGFVVEGRLREALLHGGHPVDAWVSGMTRDDLRRAVEAMKAPDVPAPGGTMDQGGIAQKESA